MCRKFKSLRVLNVGNIKEQTILSIEVGKLKELRYLIGNFLYGPLLIDGLKKLQTLKYVNIETWIKIETEKFVNLRDLGLCKGYTNSKDIPITSFQPLSHCQRLVDLRIKGKIERLPEDVHEILLNLECLSLKRSQLKEDPIPLWLC
ncbi:hypothetical protein ACOSP7_017473 [Xanthoceras sorbifolium]